MVRPRYDLSFECRDCGETVYVIGAPLRPPSTCGLCHIQRAGIRTIDAALVRFSPEYRACITVLREDGEAVGLELHPLDAAGNLEAWGE